MRQLAAVAAGLDRLIIGLGRAVAWLIVPLMLIILLDVVARKIPGFWIAVEGSFLAGLVSSVKLQETEWHLHTLLFVFALGYAYVYNMHVRVDLIRRRFSQKLRAWLELLSCLFLLIPYTALLLYYGWDFVAVSFAQGEGSQAMTGLPQRWLIKSTLLLGIALFLLSGLRAALRAILFLRGAGGGDFDSYAFHGSAAAVGLGSATDGMAAPPDGR